MTDRRFDVLVAALLLMGHLPARAQTAPTAPSIPPGEDRIEHLRLSAPAPYEGMILDMDTSIRWTNRLRWYQYQLQLQVDQQSVMLNQSEESCQRRLHLIEESYSREVTGLRSDLRDQAHRYEAALAAARHQEWYESWGFAFVLGAVLAGALLGLGAGLVASL